MPKAIWEEQVIAETPEESVEIIKGIVYFPSDAVNTAYLQASDHHTVCPWKNTASYHHVEVDRETNENAARCVSHAVTVIGMVSKRLMPCATLEPLSAPAP